MIEVTTGPNCEGTVGLRTGMAIAAMANDVGVGVVLVTGTF